MSDTASGNIWESMFTGALAESAPPPLPERLTLQVLRQAIIDALYPIKAYNLAGDCVFFGLEPQGDHEDPNRSKRIYIDARVRRKTMAELLPVAEKIVAEHDDRVLAHLLALASSGTGGVRGEMKNLIFAPVGGPKPKLVLSDAINNDIALTENAGDCLVYDRPLTASGLAWRQLIHWWAGDDGLAGEEERAKGLASGFRLGKRRSSISMKKVPLTWENRACLGSH